MRSTLALTATTLLLCACGEKKAEKQATADANAVAANFTPPTVTSRLDFGGMSERRFRRLDRNGDDVLTADELPTASADRLRALDRNGDGRITKTEWSEGTIARFDAMDLNRDGSVTSDERERAERGEKPQPVVNPLDPDTAPGNATTAPGDNTTQ